MEQNENRLPALITHEQVRIKINIELTKRQLFPEKIGERIANLVLNEDSLQEMADIIRDLNEIDKIAAQVHKDMKAPYYNTGLEIDKAKNMLLAVTKNLREPIEGANKRILQEISDRKRQADEKKRQEDAILLGIEGNVVDFSNKIASSLTRKELTDVESLINLEKSPSRSKKYGQFHQKAIDRYDEVLLPIIKTQKGNIEEREKIAKAIADAEIGNDPVKVDELKGQQELVDEQIRQNQIDVQAKAMTQAPIVVTEAEEVFPTIKTKHTHYSYEIVDADMAFKKARNLIEIYLNKDAAKIVLNTLKDSGAFDEKEEVVLNGVRYFATKKLGI